MFLPSSAPSTSTIGEITPRPIGTTPKRLSRSLSPSHTSSVPREITNSTSLSFSERVSKEDDVRTPSRNAPTYRSGFISSPLSAKAWSHLPTPQSPISVSSYLDLHLNTSSPPARFQPSLSRPPHDRPYVAGDVSFSRPQQIITPESSPLTMRTGGSRLGLSRQPLSQNSTPSAETETFSSSLAPAHEISSTSLPASEAPSRSRLSSPFMDKLSISERDSRNPLSPPRSKPGSPKQHYPSEANDIFSAEPMMASPSTSAPLQSSSELERIHLRLIESGLAHMQEAESRRPDYLKRAKRTLSESDPSTSAAAKSEDLGLPGVGIAESPMKGRRIKLFQETSDESFEESLMAGGYGRYRTIDLAQPVLGPLDTAERLEIDSAGNEREVRKRRRLAAFQRSDAMGRSLPPTLQPIEVEGRGRVLLDTSTQISTQTSPTKKRANRRKKKSSSAPALNERDSIVESNEGLEGPNWPDSEFPWSLRRKERAELAQAEEDERLKWIERFLDRDSDEEDSEEEDSSPTTSWGQILEEPPTIRRGRGKMIPLQVGPSSPSTQRTNAYFPSDPADARAALLSKRSVRALFFRRRQRNRHRKEEYGEQSDDEVLCICNGRDDGRELVQCDTCMNWYHLECIGVKDVAELGPESEPWYCQNCHTPPFRHLSPSVEPTFVPTDVEPSPNPSYDPLFFQGSLQDSPIPPWSSPSRPPRTPTGGGGSAPTFSSGSSWVVGPSTPQNSSHGARVYSTPGPFDNFPSDDFALDLTSTPSRGIRVGASFTTPKSSSWSARPNGLFQTPSKGSKAQPQKSARAMIPFPSSLDDSGGMELSSSPSRILSSYDDSPIRRTAAGDRTYAVTSKRQIHPKLAGNSFPLLDESPVARSKGKGRLQDVSDMPLS